MVIARRTFLIGLSAFVVSPAIAQGTQFLGPLATGILSPKLTYRRMGDFVFGNMATGEELRSPDWLENPSHITMFRNDEQLYDLLLNPRATYRLAVIPGGEYVFERNDILRVVMEPSQTKASLTIVSNINRNPMAPPICFAECFHWENGELVTNTIAATDPANSHILA